MTDCLAEIKAKAPHLVDQMKEGALSAMFKFRAAVPAETQLALCRDFTAMLGGAQNVRITAAGFKFMAVSIFPKSATAYTAEALEVCANGSMFDSMADTYGLRSLDFSDENYDGGVDYAID